MSELFRIRDVCLNCCSTEKAEDKRAFRKEIFAIISEADVEVSMRVNDGIMPYEQLQISAALGDRLRRLCMRCSAQLLPADNVSEAWQEVEVKLLQPFEQQLADDAKEKERAEARRLRRKRIRVEGKLVKFNFRQKKKQSNQ